MKKFFDADKEVLRMYVNGILFFKSSIGLVKSARKVVFPLPIYGRVRITIKKEYNRRAVAK